MTEKKKKRKKLIELHHLYLHPTPPNPAFVAAQRNAAQSCSTSFKYPPPKTSWSQLQRRDPKNDQKRPKTCHILGFKISQDLLSSLKKKQLNKNRLFLRYLCWKHKTDSCKDVMAAKMAAKTSWSQLHDSMGVDQKHVTYVALKYLRTFCHL